MTQESTAFGTCYLRAKTKEAIMDFFDLQAGLNVTFGTKLH